ncbi:MAG: class I SAM-dependent methyltransferase [Gemmataceae bacterium]|nr:class I SAM-dependent methyltransferase [Gemmataceae bacterium]
MNQAEFDRFADEYHVLVDRSIRASGEGPEYFARYKVTDVRRLWERWGNGDRNPTILDFGCGVANCLPHFRETFPRSRIVCVDVSPRSLEIAAARFPRQAEFLCFDGKALPLASASVAIAFAACVFHHIDHAEHVSILREFRRVLAPCGLACVFEHNPINPLTRHAVNTCPFDANARLITGRQMQRRFRDAGFSAVGIRYRVFFPGCLRRLRPLERLLAWCPAGAQYVAVGRPGRIQPVAASPAERRRAA